MNISMRQISEDDWRIFSEIRLRALQTDPNAFGSNYERESKFSEEDWRVRLRADDNAVFMIFDNETPIGMTGVAIERSDPTGRTALLWGSWLAPEYRRQNLSEMMYKIRIDWAKQRPMVEKIIVSHRASNLASKYANQKHGFEFTHRYEEIWSDGVTEDGISYQLKIGRD